MMKKWLFSNNGEITGPLEIDAAKELVAHNDNLYAWHPSYAHWLPANCIEEFDVAVVIPPPPIELSKNFINDFTNRERELLSTLDRVNITLGGTREFLSELGRDISTDIKTTHNLNMEVKETLRNIEKHYAALNKNLAEYK